MKAIANAVAANRSTTAASSEPRFSGAGGTIRSRSPGRSLGHLRRRGALERRRERTRDVAALGDDLVAAGAVIREQVLPLRQTAALRMRLGDRRPGPERGDVGDQRPDLGLREEHALAARL